MITAFRLSSVDKFSGGRACSRRSGGSVDHPRGVGLGGAGWQCRGMNARVDQVEVERLRFAFTDAEGGSGFVGVGERCILGIRAVECAVVCVLSRRPPPAPSRRVVSHHQADTVASGTVAVCETGRRCRWEGCRLGGAASFY